MSAAWRLALGVDGAPFRWQERTKSRNCSPVARGRRGTSSPRHGSGSDWPPWKRPLGNDQFSALSDASSKRKGGIRKRHRLSQRFLKSSTIDGSTPPKNSLRQSSAFRPKLRPAIWNCLRRRLVVAGSVRQRLPPAARPCFLGESSSHVSAIVTPTCFLTSVSSSALLLSLRKAPFHMAEARICPVRARAFLGQSIKRARSWQIIGPTAATSIGVTPIDASAASAAVVMVFRTCSGSRPEYSLHGDSPS